MSTLFGKDERSYLYVALKSLFPRPVDRLLFSTQGRHSKTVKFTASTLTKPKLIFMKFVKHGSLQIVIRHKN